VLIAQSVCHFSFALEPSLLELGPTMSSPSHFPASGDKVSEGDREEIVVPESAPSVPRGRGRPKGSRNKSTLEALTAKAAAAASSSATPQATGAPSGAGILEKRKPSRPKGSEKKTALATVATPSSSRRGRPPGSKNKKAPAVFRVDATPAGPRATAPPPLGPSRPWLEKPAL
jgi:high mobility group AT-hook protein 2